MTQCELVGYIWNNCHQELMCTEGRICWGSGRGGRGDTDCHWSQQGKPRCDKGTPGGVRNQHFRILGSLLDSYLVGEGPELSEVNWDSESFSRSPPPFSRSPPLSDSQSQDICSLDHRVCAYEMCRVFSSSLSSFFLLTQAGVIWNEEISIEKILPWESLWLCFFGL